MLQLLKSKLLELGVEKTYLIDAANLVMLLITAFLCLLTYQIAKKLLYRTLYWLSRERYGWLQTLDAYHVFDRLAHLLPAAVLSASADIILSWQEWLSTVASLYLIFTICFVVVALLEAGAHWYTLTEVGKRNAAPINSYVDVGKILVFSIGGLIAIALIFHQSIWTILSGIGAVTAIIVLIFRDSLLGLVASVQISAYDLVRIGDWIEIPKFNIDGNVMDINLNTMRVQNFDNSISVVPTHVVISESFRNWRGMQDSGARRIKRVFLVDILGVHSATQGERAAFLEMQHDANEDSLPEINLLLAQTVLQQKIAALPEIHSGYPVVIRQQPMQEHGLPIEVYCFSRERELVPFEALQSRIGELVLVTLSQFGLRLFQSPSAWQFHCQAAETVILTDAERK